MPSGKRPKHRPLQPWIPASGTPVSNRSGLHYQEFAPPSELSGIFVSIWTLTGRGSVDTPFDYHVVPDGCNDLIFDRDTSEGFIYGTVNESKTVMISGSSQIVGVRLQPHLLPAFTGIPASVVRNEAPAFSEASIGNFNHIFERYTMEGTGIVGLREATNLAWAVSEKFRPKRVNVRADWLVSALLDGYGSVDHASRVTGFSTRQLQRVANEDIGLSPKELGRILRFQQALPAVLRGNENHTTVAAAYGYSDQAHMIREFNRLTGYSPGFWRKRENVRFIQAFGSRKSIGSAHENSQPPFCDPDRHPDR